MENKIIIARFMGLAEQLGMFECPLTGTYVYPEYLKYDSSWDCLMPVVEKVEQQDNTVEIELTRCIISDHWGDIKADIYSDIKIEAVYKAVVEFIKWYNTQ